MIDHLLIATGDLDAAAAAAERLGLPVAAGGRHPGWGTANRIVPLGDAYLELVAVVDPAEAATSGFGSWVAAAPPGPMGWAVRPRDLKATASRLGLGVVPGRATGLGAARGGGDRAHRPARRRGHGHDRRGDVRVISSRDVLDRRARRGDG
jgi:hypothetical protein